MGGRRERGRTPRRTHVLLALLTAVLFLTLTHHGVPAATTAANATVATSAHSGHTMSAPPGIDDLVDAAPLDPTCPACTVSPGGTPLQTCLLVAMLIALAGLLPRPTAFPGRVPPCPRTIAPGGRRTSRQSWTPEDLCVSRT